MNKKGFTLVELLAVIVIIGILATFLVPSIFKMVKNAKDKSYNILIGSFEENARLYTSRHRDEIENYLDQYNYYSLTLNDLKSDDLLKTPITDPRNDQEIDLTKKIYVVRETDNTLSVCYEERGCYAPIKLADKITDPSNIVSGNIDGLHQDVTNNFYYYAGSNPYNWIEFSGKLWRIVKVNSDKSIKIIYEGVKNGNSTTEKGSISNGTFDTLNTNSYDGNVTIKTTLQDWYNANIDDSSKAMVLPIQWCVGKITYSTSGVSKSSFLSGECTTKTTSPYSIGLLNGSEYLYGSLDAACLTSYKTSGDYGNTCKNQNYLYKNIYNYWTSIPDNTTTNVWTVNVGGSLGAPVAASTSNNIRPVVILRNDVYIDRGDGTFDNPFVLRNIISVDKTNPVITLLGDNPVNVNIGSTYIDSGATASDNVDGEITSKIISNSNLDVNHYGIYQVNYVVSDTSGNKTSISRIVNVVLQIEYLVVAGGGSGGGGWEGGGGGGGGVIYGNTTSITANYDIVVGNGGISAITGSNGENSSALGFTAIGGGRGAGEPSGSAYASTLGGSGGGGSHAGGITGSQGTLGQGTKGGDGHSSTDNYVGGGGGGATIGGTNATLSAAGNGGQGYTSSISETSIVYGSGGGGSRRDGGTQGIGGTNAGNGQAGTGTAGAANTGGGGGSGWGTNGTGIGGAGGSGIVIIRYLGFPRATGGTITSMNGYTIHTFTTVGTTKFQIQ
jgi:prepilin-type N-terminal cleavage/methylation domain-containing protein